MKKPKGYYSSYQKDERAAMFIYYVFEQCGGLSATYEHGWRRLISSDLKPYLCFWKHEEWGASFLVRHSIDDHLMGDRPDILIQSIRKVARYLRGVKCVADLKARIDADRAIHAALNQKEVK